MYNPETAPAFKAYNSPKATYPVFAYSRFWGPFATKWLPSP